MRTHRGLYAVTWPANLGAILMELELFMHSIFLGINMKSTSLTKDQHALQQQIKGDIQLVMELK